MCFGNSSQQALSTSKRGLAKPQCTVNTVITVITVTLARFWPVSGHSVQFKRAATADLASSAPQRLQACAFGCLDISAQLCGHLASICICCSPTPPNSCCPTQHTIIMKQPGGLGLSAFSLPKLKRDVAAKLPGTNGRDAAQQANSSKGAEQQQQHCNSQDMDTQLLADENVDPASPLADQAAPSTKAAAAKPATVRKGKRANKQARISEQHTVYYDAHDAPGSPEDASTRTQHKHAARGAAAAPAPAPASVHSKPALRTADAGERGSKAEKHYQYDLQLVARCFQPCSMQWFMELCLQAALHPDVLSY